MLRAVSVSTPCFLNSSVISSSSLLVEDCSEDAEDFSVLLKAPGLKVAEVPFNMGVYIWMISTCCVEPTSHTTDYLPDKA